MQIYIPKKLVVEIGPLPWSRRLGIHVGAGWIDDAKENEIPWRHHWTWEPNLPQLIWCNNGRSRRLIGLCVFGRCRVFR